MAACTWAERLAAVLKDKPRVGGVCCFEKVFDEGTGCGQWETVENLLDNRHSFFIFQIDSEGEI